MESSSPSFKSVLDFVNFFSVECGKKNIELILSQDVKKPYSLQPSLYLLQPWSLSVRLSLSYSLSEHAHLVSRLGIANGKYTHGAGKQTQ